MIRFKTYEMLSTETANKLAALNINNNPGGIARLFLNIINEEFAEIYDTLSLHHANAFISTATGEGLDLIGKLLACDREQEEDDDTYRYRICAQSLSLATSNETAIRLAALSVDGVEDVIMRPFVYGTGSFSLLILVNAYDAAETVLQSVYNAVEPMVGYGIRCQIIQPTIKEVSLRLKLILKDTVDDINAQTLKQEVREAVKVFLLSKGIAEDLVTAELTKVVMNVSSDIASFVCTSYQVDGESVSFVDQSCDWNERFMVSSKSDAIIIE